MHLVGAGFIEDGEERDLVAAVRRECEEETAYPNGELPAGEEHTIALVFGSNHDTGFSVHIPLQIGAKEIALKGVEHCDLLFLPNEPRMLHATLRTRAYRGLRCTDQMLGSLEAYVAQKAQGRLTSAYQHH